VTTNVRIFAFGLRALDGVDGGIETHARELYPRLAALGYDITVLTRSRYDVARGARPACRTRRLWAPRGKGLEAAVHSLISVAYCAVKRPDVVHVHGIGPGACAALLRLVGLPVVVTHHGPDYDAAKWGWLARAVLRVAERVGVALANEVICVSDSIRCGVAARNARSRTIRNGVPRNPDVSRPPASAALAALASGSFVLVVGRVTAHKRVLDVATAMDCVALEGLKLVVCGGLRSGDPYVEAVEAAARGSTAIVLAGFVEPRDLPWLYRHALCTVMASSYEGMPFAVLEALAAGSTVLLSEIPAHREIGLAAEQYFPVGDVAALRAKLVRLRAAPERRVSAAAALDSRFDWSVIAEQTAAVFAEVSGRGAAGAAEAGVAGTSDRP
jgi:glycosyltransferase involved in cell wall biosynthesis